MKKFTKALLATVLTFALSFSAGGALISARAEGEPVAKTPVNYYQNSTFGSSLSTSGLAESKGNYFNAIRWQNKTGQASESDKNWWGWNNIWMGVGDLENPLDLNATGGFDLEIHGETVGATWARFELIDADGDTVAGSAYASDTFKFTGYNSAGTLVYDGQNPSSSDWRGVFVGGIHGTLSVTPWDVSTLNANFNWDKVVAIAARMHTWDAKTLEFGKISVVKDGAEVTVFDPAKATRLAEIPAGGLKNIKANEWLWGPNKDQLANTCANLETLTSSFISVSYNEYVSLNNDRAVIEISKAAHGNDVWGTMVEMDAEGNELATFTDVTGYKGIKFELDTTGVTNDFVELCMLIRINVEGGTADYRGFGNKVNATFVAKDGTIVKNSENGKGANWLPKGFKGTVYMPFGAFENGGALLSSVEGFGANIAGIRPIFVNSNWAIGDKATISNMQAYDCVEHADANHDLLCDYCATEVPCEHKPVAGEHGCEYCEETLSECTDENKDHACDVCGEAVGTHAAAEGSHTCDYCGGKVSECTDENKDHACDICGEAVGTHEAAEGSHNCGYCGEALSECADADEDGLCDVCGEEIVTENPDTSEDPITSEDPSTSEEEIIESCISSITGGSLGLVVLALGSVVVFKRKRQ